MTGRAFRVQSLHYRPFLAEEAFAFQSYLAEQERESPPADGRCGGWRIL
jgi:hypothetical protein